MPRRKVHCISIPSPRVVVPALLEPQRTRVHYHLTYKLKSVWHVWVTRTDQAQKLLYATCHSRRLAGTLAERARAEGLRLAQIQEVWLDRRIPYDPPLRARDFAPQPETLQVVVPTEAQRYISRLTRSAERSIQ